MSMVDFEKISYELSSVCVFRNIMNTDVMKSFCAFLDEEKIKRKLGYYSEFVSALSAYSGSFYEFLKKTLCEDENVYITLAAAERHIPDSIKENTEKELEIFSVLSHITVSDVREYLSYDGYIPQFDNEITDFRTLYKERCEKVSYLG